MAISKPQAPGEQENPYTPPGPEPLIFEDFETINTSTTRVGVGDKEMAWCSGYFPIAPRMLRTLPGIGPTLWTSPGPRIVFFGFANIGALPVQINFLADGSIWQVATTTGAVTNIAPPNTIVNPSVLTTAMSQWGSQYVVIVNNQNNGYFIWDGSIFYQPSSLAPGVTLTNTGSNYTSAPTVTASGGSGAGATFVATINLQGAVISVGVTSDSGPNYNVQAVFSGAGTATASVAFTGGGGTGATGTVNFTYIRSGSGLDFYQVGSITVVTGGAAYVSAPTVTITFAANTFATGSAGGIALGPPILTSTIGSASPVTSVTITNPGTGYRVGETVTLAFSGGGGSGAAATVNLMPFGVGGTGVETAFQRVWIINGALLQFSGPGSIWNFATSIGGGSVTSNDSFLRVGYTRLIQTNGFLYLIGDSSINYISGVQTTGSPPTTTYTNQNADPEVGTPYPQTADVFGRNIVFANSFGVHVSYGAAVTKVSEALDGVYNTVMNFNGFQLSAAKATIFGKKTWMVLVPVINPLTGQLANELFMWDGQKKWWSSQQDVSLTFIQFQEINSVLTAWGTDGGRTFPLFQTPSTAFAKVVQSKLWTKAGGYQFRKAPGRFWGMVQYFNTASQVISVTIDSEVSQSPYSMAVPSTGMTWTTASGATMNWTTAGALAMNWTIAQLGIRAFGPQAVAQHGVAIGMTASTVAADLAIISMMMDDEIVQYRG